MTAGIIVMVGGVLALLCGSWRDDYKPNSELANMLISLGCVAIVVGAVMMFTSALP